MLSNGVDGRLRSSKTITSSRSCRAVNAISLKYAATNSSHNITKRYGRSTSTKHAIRTSACLRGEERVILESTKAVITNKHLKPKYSRVLKGTKN